jgi:cytoskeletal protein CcmA (bactofilin family)
MGIMSDSLISADLTIEGDIRSDGNLTVDGRVVGNISCINITINSGGFVQGNIRANHLVSLGSISGDIQAKSVELKEGSTSKTNLASDNLQVSSGAVLQGQVNISGTST